MWFAPGQAYQLRLTGRFFSSRALWERVGSRYCGDRRSGIGLLSLRGFTVAGCREKRSVWKQSQMAKARPRRASHNSQNDNTARSRILGEPQAGQYVLGPAHSVAQTLHFIERELARSLYD